MIPLNFDKYEKLADRSFVSQLGKVAKVVGLTIESIGPDAKLNDLCLIKSDTREEPVKAEVVGFRDDRVLLMPYDDVSLYRWRRRMNCWAARWEERGNRSTIGSCRRTVPAIR